jgi:hypothetical protein
VKSVIELLELSQNLRAQLNIVVADQSNSTPKILVDSAQCHQFPLLSRDAIPEIITILDDALYGCSAQQSGFV